MSQSVARIPQARRKHQRGYPLSTDLRLATLELAKRIGVPLFCEEFAALSGRSLNGSFQVFQVIQSKGDHQFVRSTHATLRQLLERHEPPAPAPVIAAPAAAPAEDAEVSPKLLQTIVTAVMAAMDARAEAKRQRHEVIKAAAIAPSEPVPAKQFPDMPTAMQRAILDSMHGRYGNLLQAQGVDRPHAAAWRASYAAFHQATGIDIEGMASAENDSTGKRIRPLDIIERSGWLVRFWGIVRKTWEEPSADA